VKLGLGTIPLALGVVAAAAPARAEPADLQSPEQRDTRNSAYSLASGTWAFDVGALGLGGGEAYAKLGAAYGVGGGFELDMNLAHTSIGLLNVSARWHFLDTRYFDLGAAVGLWYGHGAWIWIITGPAKELISKIDVIYLPMVLTASMPFEKWLQADLSLQYSHGEVFGSVTDSDDFLLNGRFGVRQVIVRPSVRFFLSDNTELDLSSDLPPYTAIPHERETANGGRNEDYDTVRFSETWSLEGALRSRFAPGVFGSIRLHYGEIARGLYGAPLYPSFDVEFRL
jgi:hypothetical protein